MDNEKLIAIVFSNNNLWDLKNKNYHNRDISRQSWAKISEEMGLSIEAVKTRWRGLRDTFRRELNKLPKKRSAGQGGTRKRSSWPHFSSMLFIKDQFIPRKLVSNIPEVESSENSCQEVNAEESKEPSQTVTRTDERETEPCATEECKTEKCERVEVPSRKRRKIEKIHTLEKLLKIEQKKLTEFKKKARKPNPQNNLTQDADYHFLLSLLPFLRKVSEDRKLTVRTRLQQVFCDEEDFQRQSLGYYENAPSRASSNDSNASWASRPSPHSSETSALLTMLTPADTEIVQNAPEPS